MAGARIFPQCLSVCLVSGPQRRKPSALVPARAQAELWQAERLSGQHSRILPSQSTVLCVSPTQHARENHLQTSVGLAYLSSAVHVL